MLLILIIRSYTFGVTTSNASYHTFKGVVQNILKRKMSFFDTTQSGVIMARCTKDVNTMDFEIPTSKSVFLDYAFTFFGTFLLGVLSVPYILILFVFIVLVVWKWVKKFLKTSTEVKRLVILATAPVLSKVSETIHGNVLIRNYGQTNFMHKDFVEKCDLLTVCFNHEKLSNIWLKFRVENSMAILISLIIILIGLNKNLK